MYAGISTSCFYPMLTEDAASFLADNRVEATEIFINSFLETKKEYLKKLKGIFDFGGTKVISVHPFTCQLEPMLFFSEYERRVDDGLEMYKRYFEAANELGAEILVLHGSNDSCPEERYFERYLKLFKLGQEFSVTVAQENVSRCKSGSFEFLKNMQKALKNDVKFVLDLKQARRSETDFFEMFKTLSDNICHIHISDGTALEECLPIGEGDTDFSRFFSLLHEHNFNGGVILELYRRNYKEYEELLSSYEEIKKHEQRCCKNFQ